MNFLGFDSVNLNKLAWSIGGYYDFEFGRVGFYHGGATKHTFAATYANASNPNTLPYEYSYYPTHSLNGNYIDIVITKRAGRGENDLVCFETKRWSKYHDRNKDRENLRILSGQKISADGSYFNYDFGAFVIFGRTRDKTKIEIYQKRMVTQKMSI